VIPTPGTICGEPTGAHSGSIETLEDRNNSKGG